MTDTKKSRIRVTCPCGQKFTCRRNRIGRTVHCNRCCSSFAVEEPTESATVPDPESSKKNELEKTGARYCPQCDSMAFRDSKQCPNCDCDYVSSEAVRPTPVASTIGMSILVAATLAAVVQSSFRLNGPEFLGYYVALMTTCWIGAELLSPRAGPSVVKWVAALIFVTAGVIRIVHGIQAGMHRFQLLICLLLFGSVLMLIGSKKIIPASNILTRCAMPVAYGLGLISVGLLGDDPGNAEIGVFALIAVVMLFGLLRGLNRCGDGLQRSGASGGSGYSNSGGGSGCGGGGGGGCGGCGG